MRNPEPTELKALQALRNTPVLHFIQARFLEARGHLVDLDEERSINRLQGQAQAYRELIRLITYE